jgi:hypothetical protein
MILKALARLAPGWKLGGEGTQIVGSCHKLPEASTIPALTVTALLGSSEHQRQFGPFRLRWPGAASTRL